MRKRTLPLIASLSALLLPFAVVTPAAADTTDEVLVQDSMDRTVPTGLGSSADGVTYDASPATAVSVANG